METKITESLPQLEEELELILAHLDSDNPEEREVAEEIFKDFLPRLENKIDSYIKVIKWREALIEYQQNEAKRCEALAYTNKQTVTWLKEKLQTFMENRVEQLGTKGKKLEGKLSKVSLCGNGGNPPIWLNPALTEQDFPEEYVEYRWHLNRHKLTEDAIDYGEVHDNKGTLIAKVMPRGKHIRIS
ncbi:siphovirus Gp157 family protein [Crocosphaera sp. XPORK-15E]|uniref:siphovirus Gp157 family protein n=1 Tax=Crocosphaera sp. XPORK-15E TaxID=3110247 RepID=UPI002B1EC03C|nr:siphovirus Gp157 family protein [Crocosphaera sp. XPORK-15E]MEA5537051.1 siphovirus Gp157 family protein [Crocosphaera sp. XPORK-15E]